MCPAFPFLTMWTHSPSTTLIFLLGFLGWGHRWIITVFSGFTLPVRSRYLFLASWSKKEYKYSSVSPELPPVDYEQIRNRNVLRLERLVCNRGFLTKPPAGPQIVLREQGCKTVVQDSVYGDVASLPLFENPTRFTHPFRRIEGIVELHPTLFQKSWHLFPIHRDPPGNLVVYPPVSILFLSLVGNLLSEFARPSLSMMYIQTGDLWVRVGRLLLFVKNTA